MTYVIIRAWVDSNGGFGATTDGQVYRTADDAVEAARRRVQDDVDTNPDATWRESSDCTEWVIDGRQSLVIEKISTNPDLVRFPGKAYACLECGEVNGHTDNCELWKALNK